MSRTGPARRRGAAGLVVAGALVVALAGCSSVELAETSFLTVAADGSLGVALRCTASDQPCTGTVTVRVGGVDSPPATYSIPAGAATPVTVTLTTSQHASVPATGSVRAEAVVDEATPTDRAPFSMVVDLKRPGPLTTRVSSRLDGGSPNSGSDCSSISRDGRFVVFASRATDLVAGDTNGKGDVFVHDRLTRQTTRVSVASDGTQGNDEAQNNCGNTSPSISADGRYVAFTSWATNLVPGDTNARVDVFLRDRKSSTTIRASVGSGGLQANHDSWGASVADDGDVAFLSAATNLDPSDTTIRTDVFVFDKETQSTSRASIPYVVGEDSLFSYEATISGNGRYVAFVSNATNLVPGDTNGVLDVFVRDRVDGTTTRASTNSGGTQGNAPSGQVSVQEGGRSVSVGEDGDVAFVSAASNLVAGDINAADDAFVRDRESATTARVSLTSAGAQLGTGPTQRASFGLSISGDSRHVAFTSQLPFVEGIGGTQIYIRDRETGTTTLGSAASDGLPSNSTSLKPTMSLDGRHLAFVSAATNMSSETGATAFNDVFVRDRTG